MSQLQRPTDASALMYERPHYASLEQRSTNSNDEITIQPLHPHPHSSNSQQQSSPHRPTALRAGSSQSSLSNGVSKNPSPPASSSSSSDLHNPKARAKAPSGALQSASIFRPLHTIDQDSPTTGPVSLPFPRPPDGTPSPGRSIYGQYGTNTDHPQSPRERLDALLASEASGLAAEGSPKSSSPITPLHPGRSDSPSAQTLSSALSSAAQIRTVSAPNLSPKLSARPAGSTLPNVSSPMSSLQALHRSEAKQAGFRNSSIDSAISSVSSQSQSSSRADTSAGAGSQDIAHLITAAGSAENLIQHLLKEKQSSATQNAQLWRLVDKQRTMILGLNKDLERALKDKDRYRKKAKEQASANGLSVDASAAETDVRSTSALSNGTSVSSVPRRASIDDDSPASPMVPEPLRKTGSGPSRNGDASERKTTTTTKKKAMTPLAGYTLQQSKAPATRAPGPPQVNDVGAISPTHPISPTTAASQVSRQDTASPDSVVSESTDIASISERRPSLAISEGKTSPRSFGAQRAMSRKLQIQHTAPTLHFTEASPVAERNMSIASIKAPPAPLNLSKPKAAPAAVVHKPEPEPEDNSDSEYEEVLQLHDEPEFERGRRKTREEDDRDREIAAQRESDQRSVSKKEKGVKSPVVEKAPPPPAAPSTLQRPHGLEGDGVDVPLPLSPAPRQAVQISPPPGHSRMLSPEQPDSLASILNQPMGDMSSSLEARIVSPPPMSPGLPTSPRPNNRPLGSPTPRLPREGSNIGSPVSPPLSPRSISGGLPLSPRAPKYPIPLPPHTPMSMASPTMPKPETIETASPPPSHAVRDITPPAPSRDAPSPQQHASPPQEKRESPRMTASPGGVYQGFMSDDHPNQLLPPPALSKIYVKVASSMLKPSRASFLLGKTKANEEESVFTLGIFARADDRELWRVEKDLMSLPLLDHHLKKGSDFSAKLPERSLFSGHAPAKVDARRTALNHYFEAVLKTPVDERVAMILCDFLSVDALAPDAREGSPTGGSARTNGTHPTASTAKPKKEGYLTKRGKNFGGWKARFFDLDGPLLRYYESPGGAHLGTIRLRNAQIGKQSQSRSSSSPSRSPDDMDNQYRHAFLILEPKKKDSNSLVRHVLCAESDVDRDAWVSALLQYVDDGSSEEPAPAQAPAPAPAPAPVSAPAPAPAPAAAKTAVVPKTVVPKSVVIKAVAPSAPAEEAVNSQLRRPVLNERKTSHESHRSTGPEGSDLDTLRGVSYEDTVQAEAPIRGSAPLRRPSPNVGTESQNGHAGTPQTASFHFSKQISGPKNATVISDPSTWGNKLMPPPADKKEGKKRSLWGFKGRSSSDLNVAASTPTTQTFTQQQHIQHHGPTRAVFGAPLAEAAEYSQPVGVDVYLPAVVYRCIEYLDAKDAASEEGIFRLSGSNVVIKSLRERFNTEGDVNFLENEQYYDVHAVASLLKLYLRELPVTVLTRELHLDFLQVLEIDNKPDKILALKILVHKLPRANHSLLRALSAFLLTIVNNSEQNKMTVRNVGIVFSPTLNIPAPVLNMFLNDFLDIFGSDPEDYSPTSPTTATAQAESPLAHTGVKAPSADDIRSPRRQMFQDLPTPGFNQQFSSFPPGPPGGIRGGGVNYPAPMAPGQGQGGPAAYDTGFTPLQPTYEQPRPTFGHDHHGGGLSSHHPNHQSHSNHSQPQSQQHQPKSLYPGMPPPMNVSSIGGSDFTSLNASLTPSYPAHLGPPGTGSASDTKARRRESSMLMMGMGSGGGGLGSRQSSMPQLRENASGRFALK